MRKAVILFLFATSLYIVLQRWYATEGNSGAPDPRVISPTCYLFGVLALSADFLEGLPVILAAGLTFILWAEKSGGLVPNVAAAGNTGGATNVVPIGKTRTGPADHSAGRATGERPG